jgi:SAM-dependent methyltransferase
VYGLELQKEAVEIANRRLPGRIFQADVLSSDFPQMSFDIVTMMGVIEHVLDPMRILERSAGLLQKGGWLMVQTPDSSSLIARAMGRLWPPYAPVEHIHLFGRRSLALALARVGFDHPDFQQHWKRLPITYVYEMLQHFGPEFHHLFGRLYRVLSPALTNLSVPFYVGEIVVTACRK